MRGKGNVLRHFPMILDDRASASAAAPHPNVQFFVTYSPFIAVSVMLRKTHDGGHHEKKKLTEADVTAESVFMLKRRQMLKMLGISATALSLPAAAQADLLDWFKGHDRPPAPAGKATGLLNPPSGRLI